MRLKRALTAIATGALVASVLVAGEATTATSAEAAAPPARDGSISSRAAASCWDIKQALPASTSGVYWLQTPQLVTPQQFYCDMETDGGGWVLVGRGRQGWSWLHNGQGQPSAVRNTPTGTEAFSPAALPAVTVNGLLGGQRLDALTDGIRVVRAKNEAGTSWQEMRLMPTSRATWTWSFGGGIRLSSVVADGVTYSGAYNTQSWSISNNQQYLRMTTTDQSVHNYQRGFAFGNQIGGSNNATSYLWEYSTENMALPFTQVWIRPKPAGLSYPEVPDAGTSAAAVRALMDNETVTLPWGVSGVVGGGTGELNMEVEDIAFIGQKAFVGGKFQYVQKGANPAPADKIEQSYLAAFDASTGEWISTFRPAVNGMVWALAATADGKLIVGGDFTSINGEANTTALAALDPDTGQVLSGWRAPVTSSTPRIRSLDVQGNWVYVGGRFTQIAGGVPLGNAITLSGGARVAVSDGRPDGNWKPHFDGTVYELDASDRGDRVYFVGNFNNVNFAPSARLGVISTAAGAPTVTGLAPWVPSLGSGTATYQQTIMEDGDNVWQGGSQHILSRYNRDSYALLNSNITRNGGDLQALAVIDGVLYGACHCIHYNYSGTINYTSPIPSATDVHNIRFIGAWDAATGEFLPEFYVGGLEGRNDMGPWALRKGPDQCLWFGGDFIRGSFKNGAYDWVGAFSKICPRDTQVPTTPASLTATPSGGSVNLSWGAATDTGGSVSYEILRDDRVVATTTGRTWVDTDPNLPSKYWVRAIDSTGNRSASTAARLVLPPDVTAPTASITSPVEGAEVWGAVNVTVDASDDRGVSAVELLVDGQVVGSTTQAPYTLTWNASDVGAHSLVARATDAAGNAGTSTPVAVTVPADTTPPTQVTGLTVTGTTASEVSLSWTASTDDRAVTGYVVSRDGTPLPGTLTGTTFTDTARLPATTYTYTVHALDAAGNAGPTGSVTATTAGDPSVVYADAFPGADGSGWTSPWITTNSGGAATVEGGAGTLTVNDVTGAYARAQLNTTSLAGSELLFSYRWNPAAPMAYLNTYVRGSGGWQNSYRPRNGYGLQLSSTSGTALLQKNVNGTVTTLRSVSGAQSVGPGKQWLRLRVVGSTIQFRIWTDGQPEPATWQATVTDTSVTAAGQAFLSLNRASTNVGSKAVAVDDVTLRQVSE